MKISVIIPVYKVESYLNKCIESVVSQTYRDLEIILVDDGSPDNCPKMCDAWAKKDDRIIVVHKDNGGLSDARNAGIDISTGEYISFVDSDDYVTPDYIEKLFYALNAHDADIAAINFRRVDECGNLYPQVPDETLISGLYNGKQILYDSFTINSARTALVICCAKMYKRALFSKYRFENGRLNEDEFAFFPIYLTAKSVICIDDVGYFYLQRRNSIMGKGMSRKKIENNYICWKQRIELSREDDILYRKTAIGFCSWIFLTALPCIDKNWVIYQELISFYRENVKRFIFNKSIALPFSHKVVYALAVLHPYFFAKLKSKITG